MTAASSKLLSLCVVATATAASAWLQNGTNKHFTTQQNLDDAAAFLISCDWSDDQWTLQERQTFAPEVLSILHCKGYFKHVYVENATQKRVAVAVFLGPTGPIVAHTPEICYPASAFVETVPSEQITLTTEAGVTNQFRASAFRSEDIHQVSIRTYCGWKTFDQTDRTHGRMSNRTWRAPEYPRLVFANQRYLYRIQVATVVSDGEHENATQDNAALRFLKSSLGRRSRNPTAQLSLR